MRYKGCVVVQGLTYPDVVPKIREQWRGYQIIFSTWNYSDMSCYLPERYETVIVNNEPNIKGVKNLNLQKFSTIAGMNEAKRLGWKRAVKWRSDQWSYSGDSLYNLFNKNHFNIFAWCTQNHGHIIDYFMEGYIDDIINLYDIEPTGPYAEYPITKKFYKMGLQNYSKCMGNLLTKNNTIYWQKYGYDLFDSMNSGTLTTNIPKNWIG